MVRAPTVRECVDWQNRSLTLAARRSKWLWIPVMCYFQRSSRTSDERFHNRFVLTDLGRVAFLEGLNHSTGGGREEDVVVLLDWDVSLQLIDNYTLGKTTFQLIDEHVVIGIREIR
jgi:hypothetical protein